MQTLLQTYVPVNDLCFLIDAYAQVNVPMAVHYIKERWIGWWHSINQNEDIVVRVNLFHEEGSVHKYHELHISKVNECDGSTEGFVDGKLYCFPPPCTSFDDRVTMFEAHCGEYKVQREYQFDPNSVLPNYKLKVARHITKRGVRPNQGDLLETILFERNAKRKPIAFQAVS